MRSPFDSWYLCIGICLVFLACDDASHETQVDGGLRDAAEGPPTAEPNLTVGCTDSVDSIYGDTGKLPDENGALIKCARDEYLSRSDVQGRLDALGYQGAAVTSGAWTYRVVFRSTRGDADGTPTATSAKVFLPDTPRSAKLPVTLFARASRGQGPDCAPSKRLPAADYVNLGLDAVIMPVVGNGFPIIVSDGPGIVNAGPDNPLPTYLSAEDMGHSVLDSAHALRAMLPAKSLNDKVLLVGHSEGTAGALSALAISDGYGVDGTIAGVVLYAPVWSTMRAWGGEFLIANQYPSSESPSVNAIVLWYHYTHAELLDGPGAGRELFIESKADAAEDFARTACWGQWSDLQALGTDVRDFFDPEFISAIQAPAGTGAGCQASEPAHTACTTWLARYDADRPHLTGAAATTPILGLFGLKDDFVGQGRFQCAVDRLATDEANATYCLDENADHASITVSKAEYAVQWLAARGLGEAEPEACDLDERANVDGDGTPVACPMWPPNVP